MHPFDMGMVPYEREPFPRPPFFPKPPPPPRKQYGVDIATAVLVRNLERRKAYMARVLRNERGRFEATAEFNPRILTDLLTMIMRRLDEAIFGSRIGPGAHVSLSDNDETCGTYSSPALPRTRGEIIVLRMNPFVLADAVIANLLHQMIHAYFLSVCPETHESDQPDLRLEHGNQFAKIMYEIRALSRSAFGKESPLGMSISLDRRHSTHETMKWQRGIHDSFDDIRVYRRRVREVRSNCAEDQKPITRSDANKWYKETCLPKFETHLKCNSTTMTRIDEDLNETVVRRTPTTESDDVEFLFLDTNFVIDRGFIEPHPSLKWIFNDVRAISAPTMDPQVFRNMVHFIIKESYFPDHSKLVLPGAAPTATAPLADPFASHNPDMANVMDRTVGLHSKSVPFLPFIPPTSTPQSGLPIPYAGVLPLSRTPPIDVCPPILLPNSFSPAAPMPLLADIQTFHLAVALDFKELQFYALGRLETPHVVFDDPIPLFEEIYQSALNPTPFLQPSYELRDWARRFLARRDETTLRAQVGCSVKIHMEMAMRELWDKDPHRFEAEFPKSRPPPPRMKIASGQTLAPGSLWALTPLAINLARLEQRPEFSVKWRELQTKYKGTVLEDDIRTVAGELQTVLSSMHQEAVAQMQSTIGAGMGFPMGFGGASAPGGWPNFMPEMRCALGNLTTGPVGLAPTPGFNMALPGLGGIGWVTSDPPSLELMRMKEEWNWPGLGHLGWHDERDGVPLEEMYYPFR
ncbi:hypothetical protein P152DRAFT_470800 [Eremomyces bilateralis CBS 781.70]|uniref:SprT-like domain-containing protein n=1 Tax=Eremomyces bilateralis CBS 781.70 TaxID=1392243 RepID=A0A6G1GBA5_9PEZI|nr:uncharacterized protein P152DRAFT_470800 [Eremomyces bilateralis CBS 781.70]KAF1815355.1 hypothetical protein P152DRAFT_470800 [Eremomyces bilateralis CBS 781.70]